MKQNVLVAFFATLIPVVLLSSEPSAFGAGNLNNPEPYGLTSNEKVILQNKSKLNKIAIKSSNQENQVDSLRERLDGLQSIIESLSRKSHNNEINLKKLSDNSMKSLEGSDEYQKRLSEVTQANTDSIEKIKVLLTQLSQLVDIINNKYVTKNDYNILVNEINSFKSLVLKEIKSKSSSSSLTKMSNANVAKKAKYYFNKRYFTKSINYYTYLISKRYKPAYAYFMIGEMKYKRKNYAEAISYYKKSVSLYKKASYMPRLMLHTAISMDKTGDKKHAKEFYNAIIIKYYKSAEAKVAKRSLMK